MKRILLISYYFPPSGGAGVQRILKFARYLPEHGWWPTILTVDPNYAAYPAIDTSLLVEIPQEIEIVHTRAWDPFSLYGHIQGKKRNEVIESGYIQEDSGLKSIARWLRGNVFLPDARVGWFPFASRAAHRLLRQKRFDAIMSTGPPHSGHLVGLVAHRVSRLPWVVDMRDPWVEIYYADQMYEGGIARKIQTHLERKVLRTATAVISVSRHVGNGLRKRVPVQHYETIPNGFDPADIPKNASRQAPKGQAFILGYIGTYTLRIHSDALVSVLQQLQTIVPVEVHFVGKVSVEALEAYRVKGILVKAIGYLPHGEAVGYMQSADVLLLSLPCLQNSGSAGIVTGKVFEYMSVRRPILAVGPVEGDLAEILKYVEAGRVFEPHDYEGMFTFLNECLGSRGNTWPINETALAEYERPRLTGQLARLLDRIHSRKNP